VNVGYQLPAGSMVSDRWKYQSRRAIADQNYGSAYDTSFGNINQVNCNAKAARSPALTTNTIGQTVYSYDTNGNAQKILVKSWTANATGSTNGSCVITTQPVVPVWRYAQWEADVSQYVAGNSVQDPSKYTSSQNKWQGCIEERDTSADLTFDADSLPPDLDPDLAPTTNATRWRPMWPEQIYDRSGTASYDIHDDYLPPKAPGNGLQNYYGYFVNTGGDASRVAAGFVSCGKSVQRLAELSRSQVSSYLNAPEFRPLGGTYHDVGMIWGTRLISPTGMFANDTSSWPGRMAPNRHIIFMTDGNLSPNEAIYGMYGVERYDQRVTGGDFATIANRHNARFRAVCEAAQQRNVTVWVISFSNALNDDLKACATPPWNQHAFQANDAAALNSAFQSIAKQVASLRIYQ
jgi:hypothetical protein